MSSTPKRPLTCFYWKNGKCKNSDDECKYLHIDTEKVATCPRKQGQYRPAPDDNDDLISLLSRSGVPAPSSEQTGDTLISAAQISRAITCGESLIFMENLFASNPLYVVREALTAIDDGTAAIIKAIEYNREDLVKLFLQYGADPNTAGPNPKIHALPFAIMNKSPTTNSIVNQLLSYGANPAVIPRDLWDGELNNFPIPAEAQWCQDIHKAELSSCITISIKYRLQQASKATPLGLKQFENKLLPYLQPVARAEYFLVGQKIVIEKVKDYLITHLLSSHGKPLVMVFTGLPGHGKTSLARLMGEFVPVSSLIKYETRSGEDDADREPNQDNLNDGLTIIFADDSNEANLWRLVNFLDDDCDYGYPSHRGQKQIDRSRTVCIIATTEGKRTLIPFYNEYIGSRSEDYRIPTIWEYIEKSLRDEVITHFPRVLSRHIGPIVPFMPFSKDEAIVLTHGFITKAFSALTKSFASINPAQNGQPSVQSMAYADEETCSCIAKSNYDFNFGTNFGAGSIERAVFKDVQVQMVERFVEESDAIAACLAKTSSGWDNHEISVVVAASEEGVSVKYAYE